MRPVLQAHGLTKTFGSVNALAGVDMTLVPNEVVALVGDNGAGKSTLVKCLSGALEPDGGSLVLDGEPVRFGSPHEARLRGIETVYQDLALASHLDYAANVFLGREQLRGGILGALGFLDRGAMRATASAALDELEIAIRADEPLSGMSGGQRQSVAIARAAHWGTRVILLDEPTAALGVHRTAKVLELIARIRDRGTGIVLISHNMPQIFEIADRIVVLRHGRVAFEAKVAETTIEQVVGAMVGERAAAADGGRR